jgi:hypothetical protein
MVLHTKSRLICGLSRNVRRCDLPQLSWRNRPAGNCPKAFRIGENKGLMVMRLRTSTDRTSLRLICLALLAGLSLCAAQPGRAQGITSFPAEQSHGPAEQSHGKERPLPDRLPDKPTLPPEFTIPIEPLGFSAPGAIYLGQRNALASLDFLDENRLLFTFRVPGLIHREPGDRDGSDERQIRAVVLSLPAGAVIADALWTVQDRMR